MIFKAPEMLLLLAVLPILGSLRVRTQKKQEEAAEKLRGQRPPDSSKPGKQLLLYMTPFAAIILALAQPAWNPHPGTAGMQGRDLVFALDISQSMLAADVFPSRLDAAKIAIFESLDHLRGQRIGLITFAGAASVRVPLTLDHNFVRYMLDRAAPSDADVGSTSLQSAIEKAIDIVLKESKQGQQDLIILTDGEDLLSDIEMTAEELRDCGARVLIIGLGDPIGGARIPDTVKTNQWMQYKGADVITRLDEEKLKKLSAESPNVTYFAAQTKPFDLTAIYRKMLTETQEIPGTENGQTVYTEGYPFLIAFALLLWILPLKKRFLPLLTALFIAGCSPDVPPDDVPQKIEEARTEWADAQSSIEIDPSSAVTSLELTRAELLQAALKHPGDPRIAQQIAGLSRQVNEVKKAVIAKGKAEEDLQKKLEEAVKRLNELTQREDALSKQSQQLLRKRPPTPPEEQAAAAPAALLEQTEVSEGTGAVLATVQQVQTIIQNALKAAFGESEAPLPTEFDGVVSKLSAARIEQQSAMDNLQPEALLWPRANSALRTATLRMQEALALLANQNQKNNSDEPSSESDESNWDFDEDAEWDESDQQSNMSMPMSSQSFKTALENQTLPSPNYTSEEILTEEAANMEQRAQKKSERAGANVEKNW